MRSTEIVRIVLILTTLQIVGCGGSNDKYGNGGGQHTKLMHEACDLSMKILAERESGKSVDEVNQEFAAQVADIDARIAKLPKLSDAESIKLINTSKPRDVELKFSALAEKGKLHETGKILKLPNYALDDSSTAK